jgi:hypothetical protein
VFDRGGVFYLAISTLIVIFRRRERYQATQKKIIVRGEKGNTIRHLTATLIFLSHWSTTNLEISMSEGNKSLNSR